MRLRSWVKIVLIILMLMLLKNMQKKFVETCIEQGYSYEYCIKHS